MKKIKSISFLTGMLAASLFILISSCGKQDYKFCTCDYYNSSGVYMRRTVESISQEECMEKDEKDGYECRWD